MGTPTDDGIVADGMGTPTDDGVVADGVGTSMVELMLLLHAASQIAVNRMTPVLFFIFLSPIFMIGQGSIASQHGKSMSETQRFGDKQSGTRVTTSTCNTVYLGESRNNSTHRARCFSDTDRPITGNRSTRLLATVQ